MGLSDRPREPRVPGVSSLAEGGVPVFFRSLSLRLSPAFPPENPSENHSPLLIGLEGVQEWGLRRELDPIRLSRASVAGYPGRAALRSRPEVVNRGVQHKPGARGFSVGR